MKRALPVAFTFAAVILGKMSAVAQCAMCKAVVETNMNGQETTAMAAGINNGILYLMGIPYLLIALAGFLIYRHYKMNQKTVH